MKFISYFKLFCFILVLLNFLFRKKTVRRYVNNNRPIRVRSIRMWYFGCKFGKLVTVFTYFDIFLWDLDAMIFGVKSLT